MKPNPWAFLVLLVLAVQVAPLVKTVSAQSAVLPHDVQGSGARSPHEGSVLTVRGVITANAANNHFFIQTEPGNEDANPATSEGLFVAEVTSAGVGSIVHVTGTVEESEDGGGTVTRLVNVTSFLEVGTAPVLPDPIVLTENELSLWRLVRPARTFRRHAREGVAAIRQRHAPRCLVLCGAARAGFDLYGTSVPRTRHRSRRSGAPVRDRHRAHSNTLTAIPNGFALIRTDSRARWCRRWPRPSRPVPR